MKNRNISSQPDTPRKTKRKPSADRVLYLIVVASFILPIVFIVLRMIFGDNGIETEIHSDADYVLMLVECVLGLFVINIPNLLSKRLRFTLPIPLYVLYIIFLYCAIFLGEVRSFYYNVPHWDDVLHTFSSLMLGFFGVMVITILNHDEHLVVRLSPFFVSLFSFCFAVTVGALWELYEFAFDGLLGLNMQKFITADGVLLTGHEALRDTIKDIAVDVLGALTASVIGGISVRRERKWLIPELKD